MEIPRVRQINDFGERRDVNSLILQQEGRRGNHVPPLASISQTKDIQLSPRNKETRH
jgi:hypothetical protein